MKLGQWPLKEDENAVSVLPKGVGQYIEAALARERHEAGPGMHGHGPGGQRPAYSPHSMVFGEGLAHPSHGKATGPGLAPTPPLCASALLFIHRTGAIVNTGLPARSHFPAPLLLDVAMYLSSRRRNVSRI